MPAVREIRQLCMSDSWAVTCTDAHSQMCASAWHIQTHISPEVAAPSPSVRSVMREETQGDGWPHGSIHVYLHDFHHALSHCSVFTSDALSISVYKQPFMWNRHRAFSPHTCSMSKLERLSSALFGSFPKPTAWAAHTLHAAFGQVCAGEEVSRLWASLSSSFLPVFTQLFPTISCAQPRATELRDCLKVCAVIQTYLSVYRVSSLSSMSGFSPSLQAWPWIRYTSFHLLTKDFFFSMTLKHAQEGKGLANPVVSMFKCARLSRLPGFCSILIMCCACKTLYPFRSADKPLPPARVLW